MKIELLEQLFLNTGANAIAEQRAVRHDDGGARGLPARPRLALEFAHDELEEQQRRLRSLTVVREVALACLSPDLAGRIALHLQVQIKPDCTNGPSLPPQ